MRNFSSAPRDVRAIALDQLREFPRALLVENDAVLVIGNARLEIVHAPAARCSSRCSISSSAARCTATSLSCRFDLLLALGLPVGEPRQFRRRSIRCCFAEQSHCRLAACVSSSFRSRDQRLVAPRLARLPLQRTDLPLHFLDDVREPQQVRLGRLQLAQRLLLLRYVQMAKNAYRLDDEPVIGWETRASKRPSAPTRSRAHRPGDERLTI